MKKLINIKIPEILFICFCLFIGACKKDVNEALPLSTVSRLYVSNADLDPAVVNTLVFDRADGEDLEDPYEFDSKLPDGNGIHYDANSGTVFQVSRRDKKIKTFKVRSDGRLDTARSFLDEDLASAREIAYDRGRDMLYISSNADSAIYVYEKASTLTGNVNVSKKLKLDGQPWGIHLDNNRLFVVLDQGRREIQLFEAAAALEVGVVEPTKKIELAGLGRLHGITYSSSRNILIVTDIGLDAGRSYDGAIHFIEKADSTFIAGGKIIPTKTISGLSTLLGNPVDVAWDARADKDLIYIAEKIDKKILVFKYENTGNIAPRINKSLTGSPEAIFIDAR